MSNTESSMSDRLRKIITSLEGDSGLTLGAINVDVQSSDIKPLWSMKPRLSEDDALAVIGPRVLGNDWERPEFKPLLQYVLYSVPEEAWTTDLFGAIDIRPFISQLRTFEENGGELPMTVVMGPAGTSVTVSPSMLLKERAGAEDKATKEAEDLADDGTSNAAKFPYSPNAAGLSPTARSAQITTKLAQNPGMSPEEALGAGPEETGQVVSRAEIMRAFDISGSNNPLALFDVLEQYRSEGAVVPDTILMGTGGQGEQAGPAVNPMSLEEAMTYLRNSNLAPAQVRALQERLIKSGYMDRIEGAYSWGDITDPVTTRAYQSMVLDMYRNNTSLDETLRQKAIQRAESMPSMRGEMWNATLDQIAQNMIGRNLLATERAQLTATLNQMRAMSQVAPGSQFGVEETDIQSALVSQLPEEVRSVGGADALYRQDQMLKSRWF